MNDGSGEADWVTGKQFRVYLDGINRAPSRGSVVIMTDRGVASFGLLGSEVQRALIALRPIEADGPWTVGLNANISNLRFQPYFGILRLLPHMG